MNRAETLAEAVLLSRTLLVRYLAGFDDSNHTTQGMDLPNHVAWNLGHLAITMYRAAEKIDGVAPPEGEFVKGDGSAGGGERFDTESVSFGSTPSSDPKRYPSMKRCTEVFSNACEYLARVVRAADDARLDKMVPWGQIEIPVYGMIQRMVFHNGAHCGQIADIRRALRMRSVFA